jgi:hypothetical protein
MIQRIQSLYMLLFIVLGVVNFFYFPSEKILFESLLATNGKWAPYVSLILSAGVFVNLFFYSKRSLQLIINQLVWVLYVLFWGSIISLITQEAEFHLGNHSIELLLVFAGAISLLLSNRSIKKDEALIRSIDRLR